VRGHIVDRRSAGLGRRRTAAPTLAHCDAPVASVMVGKMQCKAANCNNGNNGGAGASGLAALLQMANAANGGLSNVSGIADGIKDVLVTALSESGCFEVQDREQLDEIAKELELAGKKVQTQQAEFLISGAVTQIDVSTENKSFGAGLLPSWAPSAPRPRRPRWPWT
jgi:curli biogenesis system outer membrane secretion channel CsgG